MPPALLIIADDLTGANDTGVQFAKQGIDVLVSIQHNQPLPRNCQVWVVNTESRHLKPEAAFARVYEVARQGAALGIPQFYKKTDSTLRGNVGAELAALLSATGARALYFAPAYPKLHRTTQGGIHFVNGQPLSQTSFAQDALNPLQDDFLPTLLARQTDVPVALWATDALPLQPTIYVVDAASEEELQHAAQWLKTKPVLAGSAGLAECLAATMDEAATAVALPEIALPLLVVNGSRHEVSLQQIAAAVATGWPVIEAAPTVTAAQISSLLARQQCAIVTTAPHLHDEHFAARVATLIQQTLAQTSVATLVVFGGDTLAAIAAACGWNVFHPLTEWMPGVPLVRVGGQTELLLLTKAGGFGSLDLLSSLLKNKRTP